MKLDVLLGEAAVVPADVADRIVVVIDVLRAATTVAQALTHGARAVIPFESVDDAAQCAKSMDQDAVRLGGERRMMRIPGFDFGNSPMEYMPDAVRGRTIVYTTTNGTRALTATHGARAVLFAGFVNTQATVDAVCALAEDVADIAVVCAGTDRRLALEDVVCAGRLVRGIRAAFPDIVCTDGAHVAETVERPYQTDLRALRQDATHARTLDAAGFVADVTHCLTSNALTMAVRYQDRALSPFVAATHALTV